MSTSRIFTTSVVRGHVAKYLASVLLACAAAVLMAVPILGQTATVTLVGAGDIADCTNTNDEATAALLSNIPGTVITLGDNAYSSGTRAQFANCYDNYRLSDGSTYDSSRTTYWGKEKGRTMPTLGNHEYLNSSDPDLKSNPYFDYFSAQNGFLKPAAPIPNTADNPGLTKGAGYYSYDRGSWHIVALNSNCAYVSCVDGSAQANWLQNDLASHPSQCTLAYFHHPLYASGTGSDTPEMLPLWQILYDRGADVILSGHAHRYERFARLRPNPDPTAYGIPDSAYGIRQFIVGTGGEPGGVQYGEDDPNKEIKLLDTPGVIKLELGGGSYTWQFITMDGTVADSSSDVYGAGGSEQCHGTPPSADTTAPTVTNVAPADGATGVAVATNVEATFSEAMDENSVETAGNFTLVKHGTTTPMAATVSYDPATNSATLNPNTDLEAGVTYTATVKGGANGVKDAAGNPLGADKVWTFTTTAAPVDTTPPDTTITSGPLGTAKSRDATFTFSSTEPSNATFQTRLDRGNWEANGTATSKTYTNLANGTHTFKVKATDAAGNTDPTPASRSWKVRAR
jgi:acid phosphatase type 7